MKTFLIDEELRDKLFGEFELDNDICDELQNLPETKPDAKGLSEGLSDLELKMQSLEVAIANDLIDARTLLQKISALSTYRGLQPSSPPIPTKEELWPIVKEWWDGYDADVDSEVDELTKKIHSLLTARLKGATHE